MARSLVCGREAGVKRFNVVAAREGTMDACEMGEISKCQHYKIQTCCSTGRSPFSRSTCLRSLSVTFLAASLHKRSWALEGTKDCTRRSGGGDGELCVPPPSSLLFPLLVPLLMASGPCGGATNANAADEAPIAPPLPLPPSFSSMASSMAYARSNWSRYRCFRAPRRGLPTADNHPFWIVQAASQYAHAWVSSRMHALSMQDVQRLRTFTLEDDYGWRMVVRQPTMPSSGSKRHSNLPSEQRAPTN